MTERESMRKIREGLTLLIEGLIDDTNEKN